MSTWILIQSGPQNDPLVGTPLGTTIVTTFAILANNAGVFVFTGA